MGCGVGDKECYENWGGQSGLSGSWELSKNYGRYSIEIEIFKQNFMCQEILEKYFKIFKRKFGKKQKIAVIKALSGVNEDPQTLANLEEFPILQET